MKRCYQALSSMCEESIIGTNLSRKATLLMAEVLHMGNKVLSLSAAAKIQVREPPRESHHASPNTTTHFPPIDGSPYIRPGG